MVADDGPYVPGLAAVQFNRSTLDSKMIWTLPVALAGMTIASAGAETARPTRALDALDMGFGVASGDKETWAKPVRALAEAGNVKIVRGLWKDEFLRILENFPAANHEDEVDALSGAYDNLVTRGGSFQYVTICGTRDLKGIGAAPGGDLRFSKRGLTY